MRKSISETQTLGPAGQCRSTNRLWSSLGMRDIPVFYNSGNLLPLRLSIEISIELASRYFATLSTRHAHTQEKETYTSLEVRELDSALWIVVLERSL